MGQPPPKRRLLKKAEVASETVMPAQAATLMDDLEDF